MDVKIKQNKTYQNIPEQASHFTGRKSKKNTNFVIYNMSMYLYVIVI